MYQFIEENFFPKQKFIQSVSRSASIHWTLNNGEIKLVTGIKEFPVLFNKYVNFLDDKTLFLNDCIPSEIYRKLRYKTMQYISTRGWNSSKRLLMAFAISNNGIVDFESPGIFVHIFICADENLGIIKISRADGVGSLNDKILLIIELFGDFKGRVAYASSFQKKYCTNLINNEYDILQLLAKGYTTDLIANILCLSKHTVNDRRKEILDKFKAKNIFQLIRHAHEEGYI